MAAILVLLATILVKMLPLTAALWGVVAIVTAYEYGILTPSRTRPRPLLRVFIFQIGRLTISAGVQYAN